MEESDSLTQGPPRPSVRRERSVSWADGLATAAVYGATDELEDRPIITVQQQMEDEDPEDGPWIDSSSMTYPPPSVWRRDLFRLRVIGSSLILIFGLGVIVGSVILLGIRNKRVVNQPPTTPLISQNTDNPGLLPAASATAPATANLTNLTSSPASPAPASPAPSSSSSSSSSSKASSPNSIFNLWGIFPGSSASAPPSADSGSTPYPSSAPSDPNIKIPVSMGCLEAQCEGDMANLGKNYSDHDNVMLLDCIQRTGMSNDDSKRCFESSNISASKLRMSLYRCAICKECLKVDAEETARQCNGTNLKPNETKTASEWSQYIPSRR